MFKFLLILSVCWFGANGHPGFDHDHGHTAHCRPSVHRDLAAPSCETLQAAALESTNPDLYDPPGGHYVPMASDYYHSMYAKVLGAKCPGDKNSWNALQLQTWWMGKDSGDAWDFGYYKRVIRRECSFPTEEYPFLCEGHAGNPATHGNQLGWLSFIPVLTDNSSWTLFAQCWDPSRPGYEGTNHTRSWNVFSKRKTLTRTETNLILQKVEELGYDEDKISYTDFDNPCLNPVCPSPAATRTPIS